MKQERVNEILAAIKAACPVAEYDSQTAIDEIELLLAAKQRCAEKYALEQKIAHEAFVRVVEAEVETCLVLIEKYCFRYGWNNPDTKHCYTISIKNSSCTSSIYMEPDITYNGGDGTATFRRIVYSGCGALHPPVAEGLHPRLYRAIKNALGI